MPSRRFTPKLFSFRSTCSGSNRSQVILSRPYLSKQCLRQNPQLALAACHSLHHPRTSPLQGSRNEQQRQYASSSSTSPLASSTTTAQCRLPKRRHPPTRTHRQQPPPTRPFTSTSHPLAKKQRGGKQDSKSTTETAELKTSSTPKAPEARDDPYDFSELEARITRIVESLKGALAELKPGGRFNVQLLEDLRVSVVGSGGVGDGSGSGGKGRGKKGAAGKEGEEGGGGGERRASYKLADLAQVVPKGGRAVVVYVGEEEHLKPITSAILSSPWSLNPQPSPTGPLELSIQIPPPTAESRKQTLEEAKKMGQQAEHSVRQARGAQQKRLRAMQVARSAGPDDLKKAGDRMEKIAEAAQGEVKRVMEGARKVLDG
ncbi:hypothetical protein MMC25_004561 [Agyrium rufum]|nr:hypothetical protein [Agyrium rufum]